MKTVYKPNPGWWGKPEHNLTEVTFQTIKSDATRVAALLSGEIDMMDPVPVQDIDRIKSSPNVTALIGPEIRTIFLNMDSMREELLYSSVKGKNPFKDVRVRQAFYQAIDIEAIPQGHGGHVGKLALMISRALCPRRRVQAPSIRWGRRQSYDGSGSQRLRRQMPHAVRQR